MFKSAAIIQRLMVSLVPCVSAVGCVHMRNTVAASVKDIGRTIATKNRYRLMFGNATANTPTDDGYNRRLRTAFPRVFAADGIPFTLEDGSYSYEQSGGWSWFMFVPSCYTLPICHTYENRKEYTVSIADAPGAAMQFVHIHRRDEACSLFTPSAMLFYIGEPLHLGNGDEFKGCRWFSSRKIAFGQDSSAPSGDNTEDPILDDATVYGIAATLKRMEDDGLVSEAVIAKSAKIQKERKLAEDRIKEDMRKRKAAVAQQQVALEVQRQAALAAQEQQYQQRQQPVQVVPQQQVINQTINNYITIQQAVPQGAQKPELVLKVEDYHYDDITRRGKFSVRFGDGQLDQLEEAREYIRKNIEKIVRDKNIVLETGSMPPPGRYHSLGETLKDGSILEIEFKAE